ncbi:MAG: DNA recombination protein RmuC [Candidatus Bipolaricaulota bacterium]|nr:DNA recombination protein RmuC [Candidatus Bipolaricaulota bacterium]
MSTLLLVGVVAAAVGFIIGAALVSRRHSGIHAQLQDAQKRVNELGMQLAQAGAELTAEREKVLWTEEAREQMRNAFKVLASEELDSKSVQLKTTAKEELGGVVEPLQTDLTRLDAYVRALESKREGAYSELGTQLNLLRVLQDSVKQQTTTLAQALRSPTVRGRWGEIQLRRLVELAGLQEHVDFDEQESGETGRPDMIVRLPKQGVLPIDSKGSLDAFLDAMATEDEQLRKGHLLRHAQALRARVRELSQKAYWSQFKATPEFVVMYVQVEASLGAAFQYDAELFEYAMSNRVLISSPVVLFALLKAVAYGWQQQQVADNAARIADQAQTLYDRVSTFVGHINRYGQGTRRFRQEVQRGSELHGRSALARREALSRAGCWVEGD